MALWKLILDLIFKLQILFKRQAPEGPPEDDPDVLKLPEPPAPEPKLHLVTEAPDPLPLPAPEPTVPIRTRTLPKDEYVEEATFRKFRLTTYHVTNVADYKDRDPVPVYSEHGDVLAHMPAAAFASMALEGTGRLPDGRLLNVAGKGKVFPVDAETFEPVRKIAQRNGWLPYKAGYAGIRVDNSGKVVAAKAFYEVPKSRHGKGYGIGRKEIPYDPFRTLAADIGAFKTSEPRFRGKGGLVPPGTRVFIKEFVDVKLPDGTVHDGWFSVCDTGGGIYSCHFDVFVGTTALRKQVRIPAYASVWFEGIADRVPLGYTRGLKPER